MVHFKKICGCEKGGLFEARIFRKGKKYGEPWDGGFNVHIQDEKAYISLLDKGWNREANDCTEAFCKSNGVSRIVWERRGEYKERRI